jgi:hypothetical protein
VESSFYPGLSHYYEKKAELWLRYWLRDNRDDDDDEGNDEDEFEDEYDPMEFSRP